MKVSKRQNNLGSVETKFKIKKIKSTITKEWRHIKKTKHNMEWKQCL